MPLGVEPAEVDVTARPPRADSETIVGHGVIAFLVVLALVMSLISRVVVVVAFRDGDSH